VQVPAKWRSVLLDGGGSTGQTVQGGCSARLDALAAKEIVGQLVVIARWY
jgi:hypothetical protein